MEKHQTIIKRKEIIVDLSAIKIEKIFADIILKNKDKKYNLGGE